MTEPFRPQDHVIVMERRAKKKDAQGRETWEVTKTEYLPVQWRLFWFRLENPKGKIDSHALTLDLERGAAIFETYVEREDSGSARMHGSETAGDWKDYIEKAQTKSLGRALAAVGYGSQFTDDEFNEGERIVDSPVDRGKTNGHAIEQKVSQNPKPETIEEMADTPTVKELQKRCSAIFGVGHWQAMLHKVFKDLASEMTMRDSDLTPEDRQKIKAYIDFAEQAKAGKPAA
jgi:hypothetical protein